MMSVASSTTPGIDENSCSTPSIFTAVMAAPSMELEQRAAQRVSYRRAPAAFKRLRGKRAVLLGERFQLGRKPLWFLKTLPHRVPSFRGRHNRPQNSNQLTAVAEPEAQSYFEYNSTMSCSLMGGVCTSSRFGMATTLALNCSRSCSSQRHARSGFAQRCALQAPWRSGASFP